MICYFSLRDAVKIPDTSNIDGATKKLSTTPKIFPQILAQILQSVLFITITYHAVKRYSA